MRSQLYLLAVANGAAAAVLTCRANAAAVCEEIFASIPGYIAFDPLGADGLKTIDLDAAYVNATSSYWDAANTGDRPACIVFPASAEHVSVAVKALNNHESVPFAIKSGGHQFNRGWSSTNGGVLISFRPNLAATALSADGTTAQVGPGAKWGEVINILDPLNKTVVGGRVADVGVGGYLVGGGLSFLSTQYGLASDNILSIEAVLANGTIVNANAKENKDLYWALRGGGSAFAIVTQYTLKVYPMGDIWGGERIYTADQIPGILSAVTNFIANNKDSKAAIIPTIELAGPLTPIDVAIVFFFYDGTDPGDVFAEFNSLTALEDITGIMRYPALLNISPAAPPLSTIISIQPFPNLPHDQMVEFLMWHYQQVVNASAASSLNNLDLQLYTLALQPMPALLQNSSVTYGGVDGSPITPNPDNGDKLWLEHDMLWAGAPCDTACPAVVQKVLTEALAYQKRTYGDLKPTNYVEGDVRWTGYNPLFLNDAGAWQDVLASYGENNYRKLKRIHAAVDPGNFLTTRQQKGFFFNK